MIVVKNVSKKFERKQVLQEISFHIAPFECVGIIGKNGAGKTTLLNMISGILKEDSGFIRVNACRDTLKDFQVLRKISYVSGMKTQLWSDMKLIYSFENCAKMYGIGKEEYGKRLTELVEQFEIADCLDKPVTHLSMGQKMRSELVYALLSKPEILLLDEAMIGIDISIKEKIMDLLKKMKEDRKTTIISTSHNLVEIENLCDRVILLDEGNIIFDGTKEDIMRDYAPEYQMEVEIAENFPDMEDLPVETYSMIHNMLFIKFRKQKVETAAIINHILARCQIKNIKMIEPDLEDTIKNIYRRKETL